MPNLRIKYIAFILAIASCLSLYPQKDTTGKNDLSFDLGITRWRNVNIFPLYKRFKSEEKKELTVLYPLYTNKKNFAKHTHHSQLLPFYVSDSSSLGTDKRFGSLFYPSLFHVKKKYFGDSKTATSYSFLEFAPHISLINFSRSPNGFFTENNFLFFIRHKKNLLEDKDHLVIFPLYWHIRNGDVRTNMLFPIYYSKHRPDYDHTNIAFIFNHKRDATENKYSIFPIWRSSTTYLAHDTIRKTMLFPLYWSRNSKESEHRVFFPLYWKKRGVYAGDTMNNTTVFPIYWTRKNKSSNNKILFPLVYSFKNKNRKSITILPFYSHGISADGKRGYTSVFPLYWQKKNEAGSSKIVFPLWWSYRKNLKDDTIKTKMVFPLYWAQNSKERKHRVIFPLVFSFKDAHRKNLTVFPLFTWRRNLDSGNSFLAITPFFIKTKSKTESRIIIFPFYWNRKTYLKDDTIKKNVIFPFVWRKKSKKKTSTTVFPLVYHSKGKQGKSLTVFPVYWKTSDSVRSSQVVFPLWWKNTSYGKNDTVRKDFVFPVYWSKRSRNEKNTVLFPLVYDLKNKERHSLTVLPFYSKGSRSDSSGSSYKAFPPFYLKKYKKESTFTYVFPLYWRRSEFGASDTINKSGVFPVYWSRKSDNVDDHIFFPLVYDLKNENRHSFTVFPFVSVGGKNDHSRKYFTLMYMFWHNESAARKSNVLFPVWWSVNKYRNKDTVRSRVLFPIYWSKRSGDKNNKILFPLVFSLKDKTSKSLTVFPFYWKGNNEKSNHTVVFPLVWNLKRKSKDDCIMRKAVFPFYWSVKSREKKNIVVFPFVYAINNKKWKSTTVFPFYTKTVNKDTLEEYSAITPFYWKHRNEKVDEKYVFPFWYRHTGFRSKDTITKKILFPFYWKNQSRDTNNTVIFPFVFRLKNKNTKSLAVFPFYFAGTNKENHSSWRTVVPFYWKSKNDGSSFTYAFPLLWKRRVYCEDTIVHSGAFPLYWSKQGKAEDYKIFFPVLFKSNDQKKSSLTVFPFYSKGSHKDSSSSYVAVTPLYWKNRKEDAVNHWFLPLWWGHREGTGENALKRKLLFPLFFSQKHNDQKNVFLFPVVSLKNSERRSFTLFPVLSFGKKYKDGKKYFSVPPFFWHVRSDEGVRNVIFPLFWNKKTYLKNDTVVKTTLFPFYWSSKSGEHKKRVIFPFVFSHKDGENRSFTLFPLFSFGRDKQNDKKHLVIAPLIWNFKNKENKTSFFLPFYWKSRRVEGNDTIDRKVIFPFYWATKSHGKNNKVVFPFVFSFKDENHSSVTGFPLFNYSQSGGTKKINVFPFYFHTQSTEGSKTRILPLWSSSKTFTGNDTIRRRCFFPLYWSFGKSGRERDMFLPFIFRTRNEHYKTFTIFPLFSNGHGVGNDRHHLMITPLFGVFHGKEKTRGYLFPIFSFRKSGDESHFSLLYFVFRDTRQGDYRRSSFLWPIAQRVKDKHRSTFRIAPFIWSSKTDSSRMFSLQPFFYSKKSPNKKTFILGPWLYKHEVKAGVSVSNNILWRLFYRKKYDNGDFETRFMHLVFTNTKVNGRRQKSFLPFYNVIKEPNGDRLFSVFFGIYKRFRQYKPEIKDFYAEENIFWFIRLRSNYQKLKSEGKTNFTRRRRR